MALTYRQLRTWPRPVYYVRMLDRRNGQRMLESGSCSVVQSGQNIMVGILTIRPPANQDAIMFTLDDRSYLTCFSTPTERDWYLVTATELPARGTLTPGVPGGATFNGIPPEDGFSGRVIFEIGEVSSIFSSTYLGFMCGLEQSPYGCGFYDDRGEGPVDDILRQIFQRYPVTIGCDESGHNFQIRPGDDIATVKNFIRQKLIEAGAHEVNQATRYGSSGGVNPVDDDEEV